MPACFQSPILTEYCRLSKWSSSETMNWAHLKYGHARLPTRLHPARGLLEHRCLLDRHSGAPVHLSYDSCNEYPQRFTLRLFGLPESAMEAGQPLTCRLELRDGLETDVPLLLRPGARPPERPCDQDHVPRATPHLHYPLPPRG